jgi:hypothetical protein
MGKTPDWESPGVKCAFCSARRLQNVHTSMSFCGIVFQLK